MTALLTDNLPLLAGAPNGIKKLRELILELAVRGKLVPQDPRDEPASELLKRIAEEKARLVAEGKIKRQKQLADIGEEEWPFELPEQWAWVRLADLAYPQAGFAFKSGGFNTSGLGLPLIRIRDVGQSFSGTFYEGEYRSEFVVERGDYLISMDGQFRVATWQGDSALLNQRVARLIFFGNESACRFIADSLQARLLELQGVKAYTTVDHLSGGQISEAIIALPPLAEQHRIVAKVDELMALCDRLEAQQADAESAHAQLVQALLGSLTQAVDAEDFAASWQRLAEHFHTLFTTESSIDALKQTLLQLAVMGKLVPQDPSDQPASELLRNIEKEKNQLIAKKAIRRGKPLPGIEEDEMRFKLPIGWEWIRLGQVGDWGAGATPSRGNSDYYGGTMPWFKSGELVADYISDSEETVTELALKECSLRQNKAGDVLIAMYGATIGKTAILSVDGTTNQAVCACTPFTGLLNRYLLLTLKSLKANFIGQGAGGAQPNISREKIVATVAGLPPLAEQQRIVAKVDQLMALCDQLKARLAQARQLNEQLATALVEQAVA